MHHAATFLFSLAGSACAGLSLASGDVLRRSNEPPVRPPPRRFLLAVVCSTLALLGGAWDVWQTSAAPSSFASTALLLQALGIAALVWAFLKGPLRRGNETLMERLTVPGQVALALLAAAQCADLFGGVGPALVARVQAAGSSVSLLGVLAVVLATLGTAAAVAALRSARLVADGPGNLWRRLNPLCKGTLVLLALALGVAILAALLLPSSGRWLGVLLLALGAGAGINGRLAEVRAGTREDGPWGLAPRSWISVSLLGLSGVVLAAQAFPAVGPAPNTVAGSEADLWARLGEARAQVARLESELSGLQAQTGSGPEVVEMTGGGATRPRTADLQSEARRARLETELVEARARVAEYQAALHRPLPLRSPAEAHPGSAMPARAVGADPDPSPEPGRYQPR